MSVAYGNGEFLVEDGPFGTYTSPDGKEWTNHPPTGLDGRLSSPVRFLNGQFLAGGTSGIGKFLSVSADGRTWRIGVDFGGNTPVLDIAYGKGRYVVSRFNGQPAILSADLKTLSYSKVEDGAPVRGITYGKGVFIGVATGIYFTADGLAWTEALAPIGDTVSGDGFFGVAYGGGQFVAVGRRSAGLPGNFKGVLYTSIDGKQWVPVTLESEPLFGVIFGGGRFVAWGENSILISEDGVNWTTEGNPGGLGAFAYGTGRFIALGADRSVRTAVVCGRRFQDVATDHRYCDSVEELARRQILNGYPDGTFRPDAPVTRAEMAKMLVLTQGLKPEPDKPLPFSDTAGHWATRDGYLQAAVDAGMINGFPDGTFRPDDPVTRAQAAKMVVAMRGMKPEAGPSYSDITGSEWFAGWVAAARNADLIGAGGYRSLWAAERFQGDASANRGESATILDNLSNN